MDAVVIDGKVIKCPTPPLYLVKANGVVVDIDTSHYNVTATFDRCVSNDVELWKLDNKGAMHLLRRMFCGRENGHVA
jgi:hypothetical protein